MIGNLAAEPWTPAQRAHSRRVVWAMLAYALVLPPLVWLAAHHPLAAPWNGLIALAASLPVLACFASWGRYISQEKDEYQRTKVVGRMVVATNVTMGITVVWGFLQGFGAMELIPVWWIAVVWVLTQGFAGLFARFLRH